MSFIIEINGNEITSIEDLQNNFDCASLLKYKDNFHDWLQGWDYEDEADKVKALPKDFTDWQWIKEIAKIISVPDEVLENAKHDYLCKLQEKQTIDEKATSKTDEKDVTSYFSEEDQYCEEDYIFQNSVIANNVKKIIARELGVSEELVVPHANIIEDLGADELDVVEIIMALEEEFGVYITDEDAKMIDTVGDAIAYIEYKSQQ